MGLADTTSKHIRVLASEQYADASPYITFFGQAAWSYDGQSVSYEHDDGLWQVGMDGSHAHLIVAGTPFDSQQHATVEVVPQPSPDGKMLLYAQVQGGDDPNDTVSGQWYIAQADGTGVAPLAQASFQLTENGLSGIWEIVWRPVA